jgi:hypothetical protein
MPRPAGAVGSGQQNLGPKPVTFGPPTTGNVVQPNYVAPTPVPGYTFPAGAPTPDQTTVVSDGSASKLVLVPEPRQPDTTLAWYRPNIPPWSWDQIFDGVQGFLLGSFFDNPPPLIDLFSRYVMATLARDVYAQSEAATQDIALAFPGAQMIDVPVTGRTKPLRVWVFASGSRVMVIPGTTELQDFYAYLAPVLQDASLILPDALWKAYSGIVSFFEPYYTTAKAWLTGDLANGYKMCFVGHSAGGCCAQALGWWWSQNAAPVNGSNPNPTRGVYSFGAPAWAAAPPLASHQGDFGLPHVRTYNPIDPVPYAVQVWTDVAGVIRNAAVLGGNAGFEAGLIQYLSVAGQPQHWAQYETPTHKLPPGGEPFAVTQLKNLVLFNTLKSNLSLLIAAHQIANYTLLLENELRRTGDNYAQYFPLLVAANREMDPPTPGI